MTLLYKLPEPEQYKTKGEYFRFIDNNPEKLIKLYELWVKIQPHNITAHKELAGAYYVRRFLDKALEHMQFQSEAIKLTKEKIPTNKSASKKLGIESGTSATRMMKAST